MKMNNAHVLSAVLLAATAAGVAPAQSDTDAAPGQLNPPNAARRVAAAAPQGGLDGGAVTFLVSERNASSVHQWDPAAGSATLYHTTQTNDADVNVPEGTTYGWVANHFSDYFARFVPGSGSGLDAQYSTPYAYPKHITVFNGNIVVMSRNDATIHYYDENGNLLGSVPTGNGTGQGMATDGTSLYVSFWNGSSSFFERYDSNFVYQETIPNPTGMGAMTNIVDFAYDDAGRFFGLVTDYEQGTFTETNLVYEFQMGGAVLNSYTLPFLADGIGQYILEAPQAGDPFYHCSARVIPAAGGRENTVFLFDDAGVYTGQSYWEITGAYEDAWGYRDGCSDRDGHVYFGWGSGVARHDQDGSNPWLQIAGAAPGGVGTWRALAFDPTGDGGNGSFWSASFGTSLIETNMAGILLNTYPVDGWSLYGLAYDAADGNLWGHDTAGDVIKIDTTTGTNMGVQWTTGFANLAAQGGLSGLHDGSGELAAVSQGTPDELGVYDLSGTLIGGPWDMEGQTTSNGHLGVAVNLPGGGGQGLYFSEDSNPDGLYRLDPLTGAATHVGVSTVGAATCGLAKSPDPAWLYGSQPFGLLEIQVDGSGATQAGTTGIEGLAYDVATGTLYAGINGSFFLVDPVTGGNIGALASPGGDYEGLAWDAGRNGVWGLADGGDLSFYDPVTNTWTFVGNTGINFDQVALAYDPGQDHLYGKGNQDSNLYRINPANAATVLIGNTGIANGGGMAFLGGGGPPPCPEDVNGDGAVNVEDLLLLLAAWGAPGGPADINGDGIVNVQDLLLLLAAWGPC